MSLLLASRRLVYSVLIVSIVISPMPTSVVRGSTPQLEDINEFGSEALELGDYEIALREFSRGLEIARGLDDRTYQAWFHANLGTTYKAMELYQSSLESFYAALEIFKSQEDVPGAAGVFVDIGLVYELAEDPQSSFLALLNALQLYVLFERTTQLDEELLLISTNLISVGKVLGANGDHHKAAVAFSNSLEVMKTIENTDGQLSAAMNLAKALREIKSFEESFKYYKESLRLARVSSASVQTLEWLDTGLELLQVEARNYAIALREFERLRDSMAFLELALEIAEFRESSPKISQFLTELGNAHMALGSCDKASEYYRRALKLDFQIASQFDALGIDLSFLSFVLSKERDIAIDFNNLGSSLVCLGRYKDAMSAYENSLEVRRRIEDLLGAGLVLNNIGVLQHRIGDLDSALEKFGESIQLKLESNDYPGQVVTMSNMGAVLLSMEETEKGLEYFLKALEIFFSIGLSLSDNLWPIYEGIGMAYGKMGQYQGQILFLKMSIEEIQRLRSGVEGVQHDLEEGFLSERSEVFRFLASALIGQGRLPEARYVLELLKVNENREYKKRKGLHDTDVYGAPYTRGEYRLANEFRRSLHGMSKEGGGKVTSEKVEEESTGPVAASSETEDYLSRIASLVKATVEAAGNLSEKDPEELDVPTSISNLSLKLEAGTALLYIVPMREVTHMIVVGDDPSATPQHFESRVPRDRLYESIFEFRRQLASRRSNPRLLAKQLYDVVFEPVRCLLEELDVETLLVHLDGAMRYVPIAALHDGREYVAENYAIALYEPAAELSTLRSSNDTSKICGFGVSKASGDFPALPFVEHELHTIIKQGPEDDEGVVDGTVSLNENFTRQRLAEVLASQCPIVHIASHFSFIPGTEDASFLLLGESQQMSVAELASPDYSFGDLDLLTLSACETGIGGRRPQSGAEVEGFGMMALNKGTKSVLATLWRVSDQSTAVFMETLYSNRLNERVSIAEALRRAQESFIRGTKFGREETPTDGRGVHPVDALGDDLRFDPDAPYSHPYFWAPFFLMRNSQ